MFHVASSGTSKRFHNYAVTHFLAQLPALYLLDYWIANKHSCEVVCWVIRGTSILIGILILVTKRSKTVSEINWCLLNILSSLGRLAVRSLAFTPFGLLCFTVWSTIFPWFDIIIIRLIMGWTRTIRFCCIKFFGKYLESSLVWIALLWNFFLVLLLPRVATLSVC